jgi:hypothetical protein
MSSPQIDYLRTLLIGKGHVDELTFDGWQRQWEAEAQSRSSFVEYLVRIGVLNERAVTILPMMIKGYANVPLSTLLGPTLATLATSGGLAPPLNNPTAAMQNVAPAVADSVVAASSVAASGGTGPSASRHTGSINAMSASGTVSRPIRADNALNATKQSRKTDIGFPAIQVPVVRVPTPIAVPVIASPIPVRVPTAPVLPIPGSPMAQRVVSIPKRQTITASWDVPTDMDVAALEESTEIGPAPVPTGVGIEATAVTENESAIDDQDDGVPIAIDVAPIDKQTNNLDAYSALTGSMASISSSISASVASFISPPATPSTRRVKMVSLAPANQQVEEEGTAVGPLVVGRVIRARGGSVVYEAFASDSSVPVSLTMLRRLAEHDTRALLARLARELPALATAKSPYLVNVIAHGDHNGSVYIASVDTPEFTARAIVEQFGPVPADRVFAMATVIATTLRDNAHLPVLWPALGPDDILINGSDLTPQLLVPALALRGSSAIIRYADRLQNLGTTLSYLITGSADNIDQAVDGLPATAASVLRALVSGDTRKLPTWTTVEVALR